VVLRPESRGRLELVSADPGQPMRIRQNFLATHNDWATLRAGLRLVREVANQAPLRPFIANEIAPGTGKTSDQEIDAHIRATGISVHHPLGTCKMGTQSDNTAVVDGQLRVFGVDRLRVIRGREAPRPGQCVRPVQYLVSAR
jgi:choline dehydrogenase/4-pyridoxate dehydrogenase